MSSVGKKRKKKKIPSRTEEDRRRREAEKEAADQERLRKWEECWERKLRAQEERDYAKCCSARGLCTEPRTRSNLWVNVTQDRSLQEISIAIKDVPVPRPKAPPLPPSKPQRSSADSIPGKAAGKKAHKKVGTGKRKGK